MTAEKEEKPEVERVFCLYLSNSDQVFRNGIDRLYTSQSFRSWIVAFVRLSRKPDFSHSRLIDKPTRPRKRLAKISLKIHHDRQEYSPTISWSEHRRAERSRGWLWPYEEFDKTHNRYPRKLSNLQEKESFWKNIFPNVQWRLPTNCLF